jgi:hypothetical protein
MMDIGIDYLWNNPPSCISGFRLGSLKHESQNAGQSVTVFALSCKCGSREGTVLGYPLRSLKDDYLGPEMFVGPLAFSCSSCNRITEIIDTDIDGYHGALKRYLGESTSPVTIRGEGPRKAFVCPECKSSRMNVIVRFRYSGAELDIEESERTGHMQDFFFGFNALGDCLGCGQESTIAEFVHL